MFKHVLNIIISIILISQIPMGFASDTPTLSAGISHNEQIPADLIGTWRVVSKLEATDSPQNFKNSGLDIWNLSKLGDVINLSNPVTGASAYVRVEYVKDNTIKFIKEGNYDNQTLIDTVEITLSGNKFTGRNYLSLRTYSAQDNSLKNEKTATYTLHGNKISGTSILEK